jgi:hypothetical protein
MEITKALCLSTAHIRPATGDWLEGKNPVPQPGKGSIPPKPSMTVWTSQYGYFIPLAILDTEDGLERLPGDLAAAMLRASAGGCEFLRLDGDGPEMADLPDYSELWEER